MRRHENQTELGFFSHIKTVVAARFLYIRDFKIQRRDDDGNVKKTIGLISKTTTSHVHHTFLYISFSFFHNYDVKMSNFAFMEDVNKQRRNFISLSELEYGLLKFSFRRVRLQLTK